MEVYMKSAQHEMEMFKKALNSLKLIILRLIELSENWTIECKLHIKKETFSFFVNHQELEKKELSNMLYANNSIGQIQFEFFNENPSQEKIHQYHYLTFTCKHPDYEHPLLLKLEKFPLFPKVHEPKMYLEENGVPYSTPQMTFLPERNFKGYSLKLYVEYKGRMLGVNNGTIKYFEEEHSDFVYKVSLLCTEIEELPQNIQKYKQQFEAEQMHQIEVRQTQTEAQDI